MGTHSRVLLTCEHGGNGVPRRYADLFRGKKRVLETHRGLDIGARDLARKLEKALKAPLICATVTRLLVDLNRSVGHPGLFSDVTRALPDDRQQDILERHYYPYRDLVRAWIAAAVGQGDRVVHISVHSFTPVLDGIARRADVGLLFDPKRPREARFCRAWQAGLADGASHWIVRRNYPYRGTSDGLVVALRRHFRAASYLGLELEINQELLADAGRRRSLLRDLANALPPD